MVTYLVTCGNVSFFASISVFQFILHSFVGSFVVFIAFQWPKLYDRYINKINKITHIRKHKFGLSMALTTITTLFPGG